MFDQLIRGGAVVTPNGIVQADIAIASGTIQEIGPELAGAASTEIDARGLYILPAILDIHLHFNEPGRTDWEGAATGSRALAAGGGAAFFDMPLNSTPCTVTAKDFDLKQAALEAVSIADFGLWGGLVPGSLERMAELAERGVIGFKAFLCDSGLPEFPRADDYTLYRGLAEAASLDLPVAVHAENHELTTGLARKIAADESTSAADFLRSRPIVAEVEAIERACLFAGETKARLHIVHVSSGRGLTAAVEARARGVDVSIETCPHYLFFTEQDLERLGAIAKCAPPLRSVFEREALWRSIKDGHLNVVASDHSPSLPSMKTGSFSRTWGGVAGVQSTLAVLLDQGYFARDLPLERIADLIATFPARRFRIATKGAIAPGNDADLAVVDLGASMTLRAEDLHQRHPISPYIGESFRGVVRRTMRRGETIFLNGAVVAETCGNLLRPYS